jgi:TgpA N-terminal domain
LGRNLMVLSSDASSPTLLILEFSLTAFTLAIAFAWPGIGHGFFRRVERRFGQLARRRGSAVASVGLSVLLLRLAILPLSPIPLPFSCDDFSFLLAADTFTHGRLTNPTPAMWMSFETIHVTMKPTYMTMYFPGEALILAAGKVLLGNWWFGSLAVSALMCAALCWMLQAWLPANWALLGGFLAVLRLGVFSYWTNAYHAAGSLAALGGALVLGGLPRLTRTGRLGYGIWMALGAALLILTRPYEGLLLCLPVAVVLGRWAAKGKNRPSPLALVRGLGLPLAIIAAAVAWLGFYDYRAFGSPTTLPYTIDRDTYAIAPYYVWQHERPEPVYRTATMRNFYESEADYFRKIHSASGFLPRSIEKIGFLFLFYAGFILLIPLIMIRRVFLDHRIRFLVVSVLVLAAGMTIEIFLLPHYVAPFTAAFYAIGLQAMRHLRLWRPEGKPAGLALTRLTVVSCLALAAVGACAMPLHIAPKYWNIIWFGPAGYGGERARVEASLDRLPGGHLAIIRYGPNHKATDEEWVYNWADIDDSKVVWARELEPKDNMELLHHYAGRTAWLVEPDIVPARVTPYRGQEIAAVGRGPGGDRK